MSISVQEGLFNGGQLLVDLSEAVSEDSDGGAKITMNELFNLATKHGINVYKDATDNDDVPGQLPPEEPPA